MIKRILTILSVLILVACLLLSRVLWLAPFEKHAEIADNPHYYDAPIDLNKTSVIEFIVNHTDWKYDGLAGIYLTFDRPDALKSDKYYDRDFDLKVKINAYAKPKYGEGTFPRLIVSEFAPSDEPMSSTTRLWAGWPSTHMKYLLGYVMRFPLSREDLIIEVSVLVPDPVLAECNPRLAIVGNHSPDIGYIYLSRLLRDFPLLLCLIALVFLGVSTWKGIKHQHSEETSTETKKQKWTFKLFVIAFLSGGIFLLYIYSIFLLWLTFGFD